MSILTVKDLKKKAPKGEFLAYINKEEAAALKRAGGSGHLVNGIPSFRPQDMGNKDNQAISARNTGIGGLGAGRIDGGDHTRDYSSKTAAKEKAKYEKQFGGVSPTGSRPRTFLDKINTYNKNYRTKFVNRQIEKKKNAIRDYIASKYTQNPHMDIDEIIEGITGSYDPATQTFGTYDFTSGLNKGTTFDISNIGGPQLGAFGLSTNKKFGDKGKLNTKYLDTTPDFTSHPSKIPSFAGALLGKGYPINMNTLKSGLNKIDLLENMKTGGVTQAKIDDYYDRTMGKGKYDIFGGGGGDGPQPYLPIDYNTGAATT